MSQSILALIADPSLDSRLSAIAELVLREERISPEDGLYLYKHAELPFVGALANHVRERKNGNAAYYILNRHINYSNICSTDCNFCAFYRKPGDTREGYVLPKRVIFAKIEETIALGGTGALMQGGHNPDLTIEWYEDLFGDIKSVSCLGATHLPQRWDEAGKPYKCTADDSAYATFELKNGVICHFNSSWCVRVRRDDLLTLQVDGTHGTAVAGRHGFGGELGHVLLPWTLIPGIEGLEQITSFTAVDQEPIGRTPRSNPATFTGIMDLMRDLWAALPLAKARGYGPGRFSFNVKGGRCEACQGDGVIKIEMHFLPDVYVTCDVCKGKRYNRETLEVLFKGKSIADVLDMTVEEALEFFKAVPRVRDILALLHRVGLDYIHVGQQATTLSGGEAQRVKLAKELSKRATGRTLYILDEPTTGLHFHDVAKLLEVLHELVDSGNSVVVIEHNLEVIKTADWIIDLGPEGGDGGGEIVAQGTPEDVVKVARSYTGQFLKPVMARKEARRLGKKRIEAAE